MKAVNSSYSSPSFLHLMIPQFHSLETTLSENWSNLPFPSDSSGANTSKASSPPISVTPSSICTDLSDTDFHPIDLTYSRKFSLSTPPLSNIKSESIDSTDFSSLTMKSEPKILQDRDKPLKKRSNFTIEHLLSNSCPSSTKDDALSRTKRAVQSIFNKKKPKHFSDQYLHRIISRRKPVKSEWNQRRTVPSRRTPREKFLSFIFDSFKDLINSQTQQIDDEREKFSSADALERLADIACKIDARQRDPLTWKTYEHWLKQCHDLAKQIYQKFQQKKLPKRLDCESKAKAQRRHLLHVPKSISNLLKTQKNFLAAPPTSSTVPICSHLKPNEIRANTEILLPNNDLVYEGTIQPVDQHDDLFLIRLNQERQMYLIPRHDLCRLACPKQIPTTLQTLHEGSRVCALWSESLRGLHPACVKKMPAEANDSAMIELLFDDFDSGLIKLNEIRLLPDDFQIKGVKLEEWRVSSFQIQPSISDRSRRRSSSSVQKRSSSKKSPKPVDVIPSWTLNTRTSTITRQDTKEIIRVGDCVVLHGAEKSLSYIGKVLKFYRNRSTEQDLVRLQWYYIPEEIPHGQHKNNLPGALFESTHIDENAIATVRFKGTIFSSYDEYVKKTNYGEERRESEFYLVGHYDPTTGDLKRFDTNKSKKRRNH